MKCKYGRVDIPLRDVTPSRVKGGTIQYVAWCIHNESYTRRQRKKKTLISGCVLLITLSVGTLNIGFFSKKKKLICSFLGYFLRCIKNIIILKYGITCT